MSEVITDLSLYQDKGFAPGPWKCERMWKDGHSDRLPGLYEIYSAEDRPLAATLGGSFTNQEANARLMAAAPDLLDALSKAVSLLAEKRMVNRYELEALDVGRAAIAKATGKPA